MAQSDTVFAGSIPALYDRYLGPLIFEPYAADLAARVASGPAERVLEIAAGTGILTRALAASLPGAAEIVATDLNQPMLDFAAATPGVERVQWRQADATALPFPDRCSMWWSASSARCFSPTRSPGFREARRVLRPGGRFLFSVWDRIEENEFADVVTTPSPRCFRATRQVSRAHAARLPRRRDDPRRSCGGRVLADRHRDRRAAQPRPSARDPAIGFCQGTPLRNEIEARDPSRLAEATDEAAAALAARFGPGPIDGKIQALVITASR